MAEKEISTGKLLSQLADEPKRLIGRTILEGLKDGTFTFINPLASEGGDYNQNQGGYTQSGGGNHTQGSGDYNQSKLIGNLGRLDVTDLADILGSIQNFER
jgi:hypothetical protein